MVYGDVLGDDRCVKERYSARDSEKYNCATLRGQVSKYGWVLVFFNIIMQYNTERWVNLGDRQSWSCTKCVQLSTRGERECLFQSHFQWLISIPIPDTRFSLVVPIPFTYSYWLFLFSPTPVPVLIVVSRSDNRWPVNSTIHKTVRL